MTCATESEIYRMTRTLLHLLHAAPLTTVLRNLGRNTNTVLVYSFMRNIQTGYGPLGYGPGPWVRVASRTYRIGVHIA